MIPQIYRDLIADLGACEAWGDVASRDGFIEHAIEYYEDAWRSAKSLRDSKFALEIDDQAEQADLDRIGAKWDAALAEIRAARPSDQPAPA